MEELKKEEIRKMLTKQKYILASTQARILKLESQLETGITRASRNKAKVTNSDSKVTNSDSKVTKNDDKVTKNEIESKGFFDSVFGN